MTKTLTEQWRDGELFGFHYVKEPKEKPKIHNVSCMDYLLDKNGVEVLAPVPSYEEYCNLVFKANKPKNPLSDTMMCYDTERERKVVEPLQKKLAIATKALEDYANSDEWELVDSKNVYWSRKRFPYPWRIAGKALKEMEGVK